MKRYAVRRFCETGLRPDCFEVYDTQTGQCASFGMFKYQAVQTAKAQNAEATLAGQPTWHTVVQGSRVLAVYGAALLSEAQATAARIERSTGLHVWVRQIRGARPHVLDVLPAVAG